MLSRRGLLSISLLIASLAGAVRSQDLHRQGIPLLAERQIGVAPDGTQVSEWRVLFALFTSRTVTRPSGDMVSTWTLLPFVRHTIDTAASGSRWTFGVPLPLAHISRDRQGHLNYVFPIVWYARQGQGSDLNRGFAFVPLLWRDDRHLRGYDSETTWIFPYYHLRLRQEESEASGRAPLVEDWGFYPFTWGWRGGELDHFNVLYPLNIWEPGRRLHVFPFLWWGPGYFSVAPLWGWYSAQHEERSGADTAVDVNERFEYWLFPLYIHFVQDRADTPTPYVENHVLWPLVTWGGGGDRREERIFPLWRHAWSRQGSLESESTWAMTPLWWRGETRENGRRVRAHRILAPLYWDFEWLQQDPYQVEGEFGVAPSDHRLRIFFPFVVFHQVDGQPRSLWAPWPLFSAVWMAEGPDPQFPVFTWRAGLILADYQETVESDSRLNILGLLFRRQTEDTAVRTQTLWRLFTTERDPAAGTHGWRLFGGLIGHQSGGGESGLRFWDFN